MRVESERRRIGSWWPRLLCGLSLVCALTPCWGQGIPYLSAGKRDPFLSLIRKEAVKAQATAEIVPPPPLESRPPGLKGLLIDEVTVIGTASGPERALVILKGIDDMVYFAQQGTRLFDGFLEQVSSEEVGFRREQTDTLGKKVVTRIVKRIQTEDR